ncbi:MAG: 16S rRNA (uracil(1498)-N(3))-methyltransferase [Alphaproteobacteria bacterium]|nr:16S rRNA (uracil(1498)-N(3))-methyltransferase [Alphaproteobacteria bacterium]
MTRLYCPLVVRLGETFDFPDSAARHAQVLRLQPGDPLDLFDGSGAAWRGQIVSMGRQRVQAMAQSTRALSLPVGRTITLAVGIPANERMDWLVEKATELGATRLVPLLTERTVVRLAGERAAKRVVHWQAIAAGACEQSGRDWMPVIEPVCSLNQWLSDSSSIDSEICRMRLSLSPEATPWSSLALGTGQALCAALGPEGGWSPGEEQALQAMGYAAVSLGSSVLRTETAAITVLARWADA